MKTIIINEEKMIAFNMSELKSIYVALIERCNRFEKEYGFLPPTTENLINKIEKELEN